MEEVVRVEQQVEILVVSARKKLSILSSSVWVSTFLTVAYPQGVQAECWMERRMSRPASMSQGSPVARYRYMMLSISSGRSG